MSAMTMSGDKLEAGYCNRTDILIVCSILRVVVCVDIKVGCSDGRKTHHEFQEQDTDGHARNHFMTLTPPP